MNIIRFHKYSFVGALLLCSSACKKEGSIAPEPAASSLTHAPSAQSSAGSAERAPQATASAESPAPNLSAKAPPEVLAPPPLSFYPVITGPADYMQGSDFLPGKDRALLIIFETAYEIQNDLIVNAHYIFDGLKPFRADNSVAGTVEGYGGRWPDAAYAEVRWYNHRGTGEGRVYPWTGTSFDIDTYIGLSVNSSLMAAGTLSKGLVVASFLDGWAARKTVRIQSWKNPHDYQVTAAPDDYPCHTMLGAVEDFAVGPGDEVFARGSDCKTEKHIIESFSSDGKSKGITTIPDEFKLEPEKRGKMLVPIFLMHAQAADALYLGGMSKADSKPLLMRFNGKSWSKESLPVSEGIFESLSGNSSGMLIATIGGSLWQKQKNQAWTKVALPGDEKATNAWATDGFIYALGISDKNGTLYRSKAARRAAYLGDPGPEQPFAQATPECTTPFVVMYRATDNVRPDYDFPLTRKALAGHTEFEGMHLVVTSHNYVGAAVPTMDMGTKLSAFIKDNVKGSKPQLVCLSPVISRDIPIDLNPSAPAPAPAGTENPNRK